MLFNSFEFILLFLPITFFVYFFLNKQKLVELSKGWLVLASLFYYSYWKLEYLPLILFSMVFNYSIGSTLCNTDKIRLNINKKLVLTIGVVGNLLLLGYFKYFNFLLENINALFKADFNYMNIVLPLAISFFTFQQIAYLADSYKGETKEYDFLNYALFVTFFPQLIAGPIVHHKEMMPQFAKLRNKIINHKNISVGIFLFTIGLFKKVIIADNLSPLVHQGFDVAIKLSFIEAWLVSFAYTFQLYFDFSGYTDMALGIGMMFNIVLPQNFNSPYLATSIQDFWRRWHMTLSRFLRDYIYIPLGGNKAGELNTYRNLFLTFLLGGLWHGAAWTFIVWGALQGGAIAFHRYWQKLGIKLNSIVSIIITFLFVNFAWVFFRSTSFSAATKILHGMLGLSGFSTPQIYHGVLRFKNSLSGIDWGFFTGSVVLILTGFILVFLFKNSNIQAQKFKPGFVRAIITGMALCYTLFSLNKVSEFLYFNF